MKKNWRRVLLTVAVLVSLVGSFFVGYITALQVGEPESPIEPATIDQAIAWMTDAYWRHQLIIEHPERYNLRWVGSVEFQKLWTGRYYAVILLLKSLKSDVTYAESYDAPCDTH